MEVLTLGEKIKLKRKEKNMTLKELAGDRITPGQISLVESGKSNPSIDLLEYLAQKLETDIEYFLESEEKQASRICEFYSNLTDSAISAGNFLRAIEAIEKGIFYTQEYNLTYFRAKFEYSYARIYFEKGQLEKAQLHCLTANSLFLKADCIDYIIRSFIMLGNISLEMGYTNTALNYFMQADTILSDYNHVDELLKAQILYNIANCYMKLGNLEQAVNYANLTKDKLSTIEDKRKYGETLMLLSISYANENNLVEALKYAKLAQKIFSLIEANSEIAEIEKNLGILYSQTDNIEESFEHLEKAVKLKLEQDNKSIADTLVVFCENYIRIKDYNKALEMIDKILKENGDDEKVHIKCFEFQYKIYDGLNDMKNLEKVLLSAVKYIEKLDHKKELADFYTLLGKFYLKINEKELAIKYIDKGLDLYKSLGLILS
ncbi:anaerobic benzoate catabolism transcriptional regulator [Caloramator mitchellensis]|uniref:Anaerobic benzoate catabolism transcriptional regulator n=1 Tax=Caloramator mitchellensis TaxID=908809 RepID=A0A0R3JUL4_CALMK|nr:helix-turn-helix domain-containing protein [Caloramator mitchellensis]KRQ87248.1 anaerobic benzoate catabolism transcriptional regulator [Caloramator mitchellensis]